MKHFSKKELLSIPNCMGYFRILLIPVFCIVYLRADSIQEEYQAAAILLISTIADFLDGKVARHFRIREISGSCGGQTDPCGSGCLSRIPLPPDALPDPSDDHKGGIYGCDGSMESETRAEAKRGKMVWKSMYCHLVSTASGVGGISLDPQTDSRFLYSR